jgi:hypothetical protein
MYQITVESITKMGVCEWREIVKAASKSAASRKANAIIKSTGEKAQIEKHVNEYDRTIEIWRLT